MRVRTLLAAIVASLAGSLVGKQRKGLIGTLMRAFLGQYTRFEYLAQPGRY